MTDSIGPIASITEIGAESRRNPRDSHESGILAFQFSNLNVLILLLHLS